MLQLPEITQFIIGQPLRLSVIVATKNRAEALGGCLDSAAAAFAKAAPLDAEIVVVDNGSTDETSELVRAWTAAHSVPVQLLYEPSAGKGAALNRALRAARGQLLAFTNDDCWYHPEYVNDLLRHDAADTELVLRGGRVELGDPTDLPLTISAPTRAHPHQPRHELGPPHPHRRAISRLQHGRQTRRDRARWIVR